MIVGLNVQFQLGRWSIQFGNEHDKFRLIIWKHQDSVYRSGSFARWQWDFRSKPVVFKESEVPIIELVGSCIKDFEVIKKETWLPDNYWPDEIG